ncbi:MAG: response regulator [Deltaproteobacteria bacterium]|nr:response regulator [Deltaproteobacteria bacterium]
MTFEASCSDTIQQPATESFSGAAEAIPVPTRRTRVMLVDDDALSSFKLTKALGDLGFDVVQAWGTDQGLAMFRSLFHVIDVVLLRLDMVGQNGLTAFDKMRQIDPNARVLLLTDYPTQDRRIEVAMRRGALGAMSRRCGAVKLAVSIDSLTSPGTI